MNQKQPPMGDQAAGLRASLAKAAKAIRKSKHSSHDHELERMVDDDEKIDGTELEIAVVEGSNFAPESAEPVQIPREPPVPGEQSPLPSPSRPPAVRRARDKAKGAGLTKFQSLGRKVQAEQRVTRTFGMPRGRHHTFSIVESKRHRDESMSELNPENTVRWKVFFENGETHRYTKAQIEQKFAVSEIATGVRLHHPTRGAGTIGEPIRSTLATPSPPAPLAARSVHMRMRTRVRLCVVVHMRVRACVCVHAYTCERACACGHPPGLAAATARPLLQETVFRGRIGVHDCLRDNNVRARCCCDNLYHCTPRPREYMHTEGERAGGQTHNSRVGAQAGRCAKWECRNAGAQTRRNSGTQAGMQLVRWVGLHWSIQTHSISLQQKLQKI